MGASAVLLLLAAGIARAGPSPAPPPDLELGVRASAFYGGAAGFAQVPAGGHPGTTSSKRPTLDELGIHDAAFYDVVGHLRWRDLVVFGGYTGIELSGSGTLPAPLLSHGIAFAAGTPFSSSIRLDVPRVGAGWRLDLASGRLELVPRFDLAFLDFSYSLDSPGARAARAYTLPTVRLGVEGAWRLGHGFALELDGMGSLPISDWPQLADVTGRVAYHLPPAGPVRSSLFVGCGMRWIEHEDSEPAPNHIDVRLGPLVTGGLAITF